MQNLTRLSLFIFVALSFQLLSSSSFAQRQSGISEIVNGQESAQGAQPWIVALLHKGSSETRYRQFCTGSLIASQWILTAAHCVEHVDVDAIEVLIGFEDLNDEQALASDVVEAVAHPFYDDNEWQYDMALVKLATPSTNEVLPVLGANYTESSGTVYGFGVTNAVDKACELVQSNLTADIDDFNCFTISRTNLNIPSVLMETQLDLFPSAECEQRYSEYLQENYDNSEDQEVEPIPEDQLCAWSTQALTSPCFGDSGGPLVQFVDDSPYQVGVTSGGTGADCVHALGIGFFAKVGSKTAFIEDVMGRDFSLDFDEYCPAPTVVSVEYGAILAEVQTATISWEPVEHADFYRARFGVYPLSSNAFEYIDIPVGQTEASLDLGPQDSFALTLQAYNSRCNGAISNAVIVRMQP